MIWRLDEPRNLDNNHPQDFANFGIRALINCNSHRRDTTISILRVSIDVSPVSRHDGIGSIKLLQERHFLTGFISHRLSSRHSLQAKEST